MNQSSGKLQNGAGGSPGRFADGASSKRKLVDLVSSSDEDLSVAKKVAEGKAAQKVMTLNLRGRKLVRVEKPPVYGRPIEVAAVEAQNSAEPVWKRQKLTDGSARKTLTDWFRQSEGVGGNSAIPPGPIRFLSRPIRITKPLATGSENKDSKKPYCVLCDLGFAPKINFVKGGECWNAPFAHAHIGCTETPR